MIRPDRWWKERSIIARSLIYKKKYEKAYKITSKHALKDGPELAEAEWMSGWISLSFLDDPIRAIEHFKKFYENESAFNDRSAPAAKIKKTLNYINNPPIGG